MPLLNMTQYAAHRGVSKMAVSKAVKAGRIQCVDGKIDRDAADAAWTRNTRVNLGEHQKPAAQPGHESRTKPGAEQGPAPGSLAHAQLVHETAKARKAAIEAQRLEGKVVDVEDAVTEWGRMISSTRAAILLIPDKLAPKVAPIADVRDCRVLIAKEMNALLSGLTEYRPNE